MSGAITVSWQPFSRKAAALDWAQDRSWSDKSRFTVHTAQEVIGVFQYGEERHDQARRPAPMPTRKAAPPSTPAPAPLAAMKTWHAFISDRHRGGDVLCEVADPDHCDADRILPGTLLAVRPLSANDVRHPGNRQRDAGQAAPLNHDRFTLKRIRRWRSNWRTP